MKIGYACLTVGTNNIESYKSITLKNYSEQKMFEIIKHNLKVLKKTLIYNTENNIKLFRISSDIIPLASHKINTFPWKESFKLELLEIGEYIKKNCLRVSMHPGQYTVINSLDDNVVLRGFCDLKYHCDFLDSLLLNKTHKIVLHIGGVYNDKDSAIKRFKNNYEKLDLNIKNRLVIENDDKSYNIKDVYEIGLDLNIPVIFDNLHHEINNDNTFSQIEWIKKCAKTWKNEDGTPKIHYSNQDPEKRIGSHSPFIYIEKFMEFYEEIKDLDLDIMLEVKDKNLSALKCIHSTTNISISTLEKVFAKYKYIILERNQNVYLEIRNYLKDKKNFNALDFYLYIEKGLNSKNTKGNYQNGFDHVFGYFKKICTPKEKETYKKKLLEFKEGKLQPKNMKAFLYKMAVKYETHYLINSYYFFD